MSLCLSPIHVTVSLLLHMQPNDPNVNSAWDAAKQMGTAAAALLQSPTAAESLRMNSVKLVEGLVLMYTADYAPLLPGMDDIQYIRRPTGHL